MIRFDRDRTLAVTRLEEIEDRAARVYDTALARGLDREGAEATIAPLIEERDQLRDEINTYDLVRSGHLEASLPLEDLGFYLTNVRIATGVSVRELSRRMGVKRATIERYEKERWSGVTAARAARVFKALNATAMIHVELPAADRPSADPLGPLEKYR